MLMLNIKRYLQKFKTHWQLYKTLNQDKSNVFIKYLLVILFYRRIFCLVVAIPLFVIYLLLYPFIKFRFFKLFGSPMGHYATNTEYILATLDNLENDRFYNVFYLENSPFEPYICNLQLHSMWQRTIYILPTFASAYISVLDKWLTTFFDNKSYGLWGSKRALDDRGLGCRDIHGYLKKKEPHLKFTRSEDELAKLNLLKMNIKPGDRYICLLVRSHGYHSEHPGFNQPARNADILTYMKACEYLADKGYFILRMGKDVRSRFKSNHPNIIDYANSEIRSDFMDIYLSAHCYFFITTGSGIDSIAQIFRRPILSTNYFIISYAATWYPHKLFIPKMAVEANSMKYLSFSENIAYLPDQQSNTNFDIMYVSKYLSERGLILVENTESEILDAVQEMEMRMTNTWTESIDEKIRQDAFWKIFPKKAVNKNSTVPLHGDIHVKIGSRFLAKYERLLN